MAMEELVERGIMRPLLAVLVILPVAKTTMLVGAPFVHAFEERGERSGFYLFWAAYLVGELCLVAAIIGRCGTAGLRASLHFSRVVAMVGSALVVAVVALGAARATGGLEVPNTGEVFNLQGGATSMQRLFLLVAAVVAVTCEEVLFRWFAVGSLDDAGVTRSVSVGLPAISFGLFHLDFSTLGVVSAIWTGVGGALLGVSYLRRRSLGWPILLHSVVILPIVAVAPVRVG